jgi:hydroxyacylglutathione hydrolase
VVIQCAGGYRSAIAASILANHGWTEIADMVGGLAAWEKAGLDLVAPAAT